MQKRFVTPAMQELRAAISEAETISAKPEMTKRDDARVNVLLAKIAALRQHAVAPDDSTVKWFRAFVKGEDVPELRVNQPAIEGKLTPTYTQGSVGGFLVPNEFHGEFIPGLAQVDPLLDADVVTLVTSDTFALRPYKVPGWDLSTIAAAKVAEAGTQAYDNIPALSIAILNGYTYRLTLAASFEFEADDFQPTLNQIAGAYEIGFARGIGADLITGDGVTGPQGVLTGAADSGITTGAQAVIDATDIESIYFKVNPIYRNAPKCAWVMSDTVYQYVRKAKDTANRPLLNVIGDFEYLMGKRVLVSPSMPANNGGKGIVFGDLSHYVVRVSRLALARNLQTPGYVENGLGLYTGRMRADAKLLDPTGGSKPPIVYATLHA